MNIISIQSHVVYGKQGNRAAVFPLERMGHEVWPLDTVQLSFNTGIPGWTGNRFGAENIRAVVESLEKKGLLSKCDAVLTGYLGDYDSGKAVIEAAKMVKKANPNAIFCCDPVMGDYPGGLYVSDEMKNLFISEALPIADIITPNMFEAETLCGQKIANLESAKNVCQKLSTMGPKIVIITSYPEDDELGFLMYDGNNLEKVLTNKLPFPKAPHGCGDMASALFLGYFLLTNNAKISLEKTSNVLYTVLSDSLKKGSDYLSIISCQNII